jgi:hypothetical protein
MLTHLWNVSIQMIEIVSLDRKTHCDLKAVSWLSIVEVEVVVFFPKFLEYLGSCLLPSLKILCLIRVGISATAPSLRRIHVHESKQASIKNIAGSS